MKGMRAPQIPSAMMTTPLSAPVVRGSLSDSLRRAGTVLDVPGAVVAMVAAYPLGEAANLICQATTSVQMARFRGLTPGFRRPGVGSVRSYGRRPDRHRHAQPLRPRGR